MTPARRDALLRAAAVALPTAPQQNLLVAALGPPSHVAAAWDAWASRHRDPLSALASRGARTLLPLLDASLRAAGVALAPTVRDGLRAASLAERRRSQAYDDIVVSLSAALGRRRVLFLKGAALAYLAYPERSLRHCHDVDLVVHPDDGRAVVETLGSVGFAPNTLGVWTHRSGLPMRMHRSCFAIGAYDLPFETVWAQRVVVTVRDTPLATLAAEPAFVQVCGHASYWHGPESLRWVADAFYLAGAGARTAAGPLLDWRQVTGLVERIGLAVPLSLQLEWLREALGVAVPDATLGHLRAVAASAPVDRLHAAALGAAGAQPWRLLRTLRAAGARAAPMVLRDALAPPPGLRSLRLGARTAGGRP